MKRFVIKASGETKINGDVIEVFPNVMSSDVPYYIDVEMSNNLIISLSSHYISKDEKTVLVKKRNVEIEIGKISGKIYEINTYDKVTMDKVKDSIKMLIKDGNSESCKQKERYFCNVKMVIDIIKEIKKSINCDYGEIEHAY